MKKFPFFRKGIQGCVIILISLLLAFCALVISVNHQYPAHPSCQGMLGAGYPVLFICDNWGGGSPTNSWGKITFVDIINGGIKPIGFLIDFVFYSVLSYFAILLLLEIYQRIVSARRREKN